MFASYYTILELKCDFTNLSTNSSIFDINLPPTSPCIPAPPHFTFETIDMKDSF